MCIFKFFNIHVGTNRTFKGNFIKFYYMMYLNSTGGIILTKIEYWNVNFCYKIVFYTGDNVTKTTYLSFFKFYTLFSLLRRHCLRAVSFVLLFHSDNLLACIRRRVIKLWTTMVNCTWFDLIELSRTSHDVKNKENA